jgi:hypothetical protein
MSNSTQFINSDSDSKKFGGDLYEEEDIQGK